MTDTIAAIATPFGEGAIAVLRLSGPRAMAIAGEIFRGRAHPAEMLPRVQHFGAIWDGERRLDEVLLTVFRAPASYTGEDVVEIAGHGGVLVSQRLFELLLRRGARAAAPGEFTQRAYLHGKLDLTQAEAVMDLISAQSELALRAATEQLEGRLGDRIRALSALLLAVLAQVEAAIDFPDEDLAPETGEALRRRFDAALTEIDALLATAGRGRVLREGVRAVIYGAPNVGKSSLLNLLLGADRALVSARPGTTRDVIEEAVDLHGIPVRLIDTAGVRESDDELEQAGIARTRQQAARADVILEVLEASAPVPDGTPEIPGSSLRPSGDRPAPVLRVLNKIDLGEHPSWRGVAALRISCVQETGIEELTRAIFDLVTGGRAAQRDWSVAVGARHAACLQRARTFVEAAGEALGAGILPEFVAEELRAAMEAVGEIVGAADSEALLGAIFGAFCIGK